MFETLLGYFLGLIYGEYNNIFPFFICIVVYTFLIISKKEKRNEGEVPQYYVKNNHKAIIDKDVLERVQMMLKAHSRSKRKRLSNSIFSGKLVCADCGEIYGSKIWHSNDKYRKKVWQCNSKYKNEIKCKTPSVYDDKIKKAFVIAINEVIENKEEIIATQLEMVKKLFATYDLKDKEKETDKKINSLFDEVDEIIEANRRAPQNQKKYEIEYKKLIAKIEKLKKEQEIIKEKIFNKDIKKFKILEFLENIKKQDLLTKFNEDLWLISVEEVIVKRDKVFSFKFKNGSKIEVPFDKIKKRLYNADTKKGGKYGRN